MRQQKQKSFLYSLENPVVNASDNEKGKKATIKVGTCQDKKVLNGRKNQIKCSDKHGNVASSTKCQQFDFPTKRRDKLSENHFWLHLYSVNSFAQW